MTGNRRTMWIAGTVVIAVLISSFFLAAQADARDEALIKCVEGGGIYHDDGRCEGGTNADPAPADTAPPAEDGAEAPVAGSDQSEDEAKKECRKKGGRYRDGECRLPKDPVERCKAIGGMFMVDGKCFRPER